MEDLISVIIPVYKVEPYLDICVKTVVEQTYKNLEIILVDDGSPDNCGRMCDKWAERDERIKVIHQKNAGAGSARNKGLEIATGMYVAFVDSDDYIALNMYEYLMKLIICEKADVAEAGYVVVNGGEEKFIEQPSEKLIKCDALSAMKRHIQNTTFQQVIWNKLYKRAIIEGIQFPEGKLIDDEFWTYQVIAKAKKLVTSNRKVYAYRQQKDSVMHTEYSIKWLQAIEAKNKRHKYICLNMPELRIESTNELWFACLYHGQMIMKNVKKEEQDLFYQQIKQILEGLEIRESNYKIITIKQKVWLKISKTDFKFACKLRNLLGIGF